MILFGSAQGVLVLAAESPTRSTGPVFERYGAVYDQVVPDYMPPAGDYRVLFDVSRAPESTDEMNPGLEALARFMNMHARNGVEVDAMHLAVVLHGSAGRAVLKQDAYRSRFGVDNPDLPLLEALAARGVRIMICGQSAASRGYGKEEMASPVQVALSASSALFGLQAEGYRLLP
jgi:intracellular sulfur oxidation DsrE/DsrF family protein